MVELRKRKTQESVIEPIKKKAAVAKQKVASVLSGQSAETNGSKSTAPKVGEKVATSSFGGEIQTDAGEKTTFKKLLDESKGGIVIFTYPKASTPGCTTQACLFRDGFPQLTSTGYAIYGLSTDSPNANTNFKTKQKLPYTLLCDPSATLIGALGFKKQPQGTTRGVAVFDKTGTVLALQPGGPQATVDVVMKLILEGQPHYPLKPVQSVEEEDKEKAEVAAEVADTAEKIDSTEKV